ncbi:GNAT family N-acetyltransferase [Enterovibrio norvegicus FF-33]|uniref:GNAT family N-acetyltransferase n=1 Tax=Enterovibrio norvegicus FF-454 TaxID=1185651 RepID=A0A1E5CBJ4_9GAMM|nr:GNAT family N-acetyltransferase [Enterovibrio norvegicus]OEE62868.1 GNAT family N-acetyltransferase [Enterovibrio norvegicus FF-454]OEE66792.1 GNAT family N-acetyltransferase [Enterovibrio norvegicus FF-33]
MPSSKFILETKRLTLRRLNDKDAPFIHRLYNTEGFLSFVGDKNIGSVIDAAVYLRASLMPMYTHAHMGLFAVEEKQSGLPIGICGLIKRDSLDDIDLGYGFFPEYEGKGYAAEAAQAMIELATNTLKLSKIVAITHPHNVRSLALLGRLGFVLESGIEPAPELVLLKRDL